MDLLKELPRLKARSHKRLGRGYGSGVGGHTVGRGNKGDKARGKSGLLFEGAKSKKSFVRRLPFRRGKGKLQSLKSSVKIIKLDKLNLLPVDALVDRAALLKAGLISSTDNRLKVLADGELFHSLRVALPCSQGAKEKIVKAGGQLVEEKAFLKAKKSSPVRTKKEV